MKLLILILSVIGITGHGQDSTTIKLLTDNINAYKLIIASQQKEIDRQDKMIFQLMDSVTNLNKKVFVLANLNATLKKKTNKQETWFKVGQAVIQGFIIYLTSR